jgi:hypothetical protein
METGQLLLKAVKSIQVVLVVIFFVRFGTLSPPPILSQYVGESISPPGLSLEAGQIDRLLARAGPATFKILVFFSGHRLRLLLISNPFHFGRSKCKFDY